MAAYIRSMVYVVALERQLFATRGLGIVVESVRYVRGLRRKPVRVLVPENETDKLLKGTSESRPLVHNVKNKRAEKPTATAESDFVKSRTSDHPDGKDVHFSVMKDQIDGLRFERAFPGDKRLGYV